MADEVAGVFARVRLLQTQQRLIAAIEQSAESVVITDTDGTIMYVNPAFEQITGFSQQEALGQNPRILKSGRQSDAFYADLWNTITAGRVWQGRIINKKKDGALFTEDATISPVRDHDGVIVNFVAVKRDISRELELEEQYYQAQKMEAIGRLTGGIAHDFNNLLTAINGFAELAQMQTPENDPRHALIGNVVRSGQRAANLVGQLMAFSRKQIIEPEKLDLNEVVTELDKMLRRIIGENIELATVLEPNLGIIKADRGQLGQVLVNLVVNARDAMPNGGKLTIETHNVELDNTALATHVAAQAGPYVLLTVTDTGTGMTGDVLQHIFEPFFTTKEMGQGTGLGLATVYGIIKQNQGNIRVYSEPGLGTTFRIYLPVVERAPSARRAEGAGGQIPVGSETILLVEDDPGVRGLAEAVLQQFGYHLLVADTGNQALQIAAEHQSDIHLLFTDVVMPGMNGKEVARQVVELHPETRVLFMSGYTDETISDYGILEAGTAFIQKPLSPAVLARKVRQILDK
ncbi:MAG: PAS domain S-box protein [Chloroflexi bacterium]|nr:MAG: PAS domain S-box protein [Chloroflexota bacterium]